MKLDQEQLKRMYPPMDAAFARRMERMIHALPSAKEDKQVKRVTLRAALLWALLAMLCMATAYAAIQNGLSWYYNTRFTAYQEHEPQKHAAIMNHLQSGFSQTAAGDELIHIQVTEASWTQEEQVLVVALTATPRNPEMYELHPMWNLDADGAYTGESGTENAASDGEDRAEHWLWTRDGFGPVAQMVTPGRQLLLLDVGSVHLSGHETLGDGSSMDSFVAEDGVVHTVLEVRLDMLADGYEESMRQQIAAAPEHAAYLEARLAEQLEIRRIIEEGEDGVITFTIPFTTTLYSEDDRLLYQGGQAGTITFDMNIR